MMDMYLDKSPDRSHRSRSFPMAAGLMVVFPNCSASYTDALFLPESVDPRRIYVYLNKIRMLV